MRGVHAHTSFESPRIIELLLLLLLTTITGMREAYSSTATQALDNLRKDLQVLSENLLMALFRPARLPGKLEKTCAGQEIKGKQYHGLQEHL